MCDFLEFGALVDIAEQSSLWEALTLCSIMVTETEFVHNVLFP